MNVPAACIFDLDGVIVETAHYHFKAWKRLAESLDISFGMEQNEALKGLSRRKSIEKILALDGRQLSEEKVRELMEKKNSWYQDYIAELTARDILAGIPEFLDELQTMGVKLAIGSSSKNARYIMDYLQLNDTFDVIIDGTDLENTKPDPEVFLKGARALDVDPAECIVFEDAASGVKAAKAAGMTCVGVGSVKYLRDADLVISTFKELKVRQLLEQLQAQSPSAT